MNVFNSITKNKDDKKEGSSSKGLKNIFNFKSNKDKKDKKEKKPAGTKEKSSSTWSLKWEMSKHRTSFLVSVGLATIGISLYFFGLYSQQLQRNKDPNAKSLILEWYRFGLSATWLIFHIAASFYDFDKLPIPRISLLGLTIIALSFVPIQIHNNLFLKSQLKEPSTQSMALLFSISGQVIFCACLVVVALLVGIDQKEFNKVRFQSTTV
jgi:hypothetical protein